VKWRVVLKTVVSAFWNSCQVSVDAQTASFPGGSFWTFWAHCGNFEQFIVFCAGFPTANLGTPWQITSVSDVSDARQIWDFQ
jgi:hypothetical protein